MIEIISYQEVKGNNKDIVNNEFEKLLNEIKNKYNAEILSVDYEEEDGKEGILYIKVGELKITFNSFLEYVDFCLNYGADLDIVSPSKLKISSKEFGETVAHIIEFFKRFYEKYNIMFNVHIKEEDNINVEEYKNGIYDEDDIFALQEEGLIKVKAVFEGFGSSEDEVIKKVLLSFGDNIVVNKVITKPLEKEGNYKNVNFYGLIAVEIFCKPFDIVEMAYKFLPVVISIEDRYIEIDGLELQDIGNDLGGAVFELTHAAVMKNLN
ncbi:hypothetical protein [Methanothermococcus okinawensis]|uniref:Uncharacterized protein n=1 Tax=Methanothermococcus okinawensis (strain DSM 14208 / JCM 11175 / IH1) TaxID=647113 RepID=F8AN15_METOI|nr:hypothetical protein [Methanothermococcus okinawensis]AEH06142.1 hypothetical protein Metok_0147 [Methanothermococcus okinawensis IH1]